MHPLDTFVEVSLVETVQVGKMNFEPAESSLAEGFGYGEFEEATREVIADMVQVGRDGVRTAAEVEVVGEVDDFVSELQE